jgi:pyruvate dehydrogenase E2 component (dihydrolipoamide acetyltransferase)
MAELLLVPEVAAGATEVVFSEWLAEPGAAIKAGDPIAVIETEKAVVEVAAEGDGTLLRTLVAPGSSVGVGLPMALLGDAAELNGDLDATLASLGYNAGGTATPAPERREVPGTEVTKGHAAAAEEVVPALLHSSGTPGQARQERVFISPIARKLLREAGLSHDDIAGTGPHGRIRRRDVEDALRAQQQPAAAAPASSAEPAPLGASAQVATTDGRWTEIPHSRLRRAVARRLTESKRDLPHFYVKRSVSIDALLELRKQLNSTTGHKISVNDFLIRAIALAHQRVPEANVVWTEDAMRQFATVDISVAIASERGLVTPVLRGVEKLSLSAISAQVKDFVEKANAGKLQQADLDGGSISISNLGMYGVEEFAAIINPPQSAILAVGAGRPLPVVVDGQVVTRIIVDLVLSVDHRAVDGALAAQWMAALVDAIENPLTLVV